METKSQNSIGNPLQSNSAGNSNGPPDPGSFGMQPQVPDQGVQPQVPSQAYLDSSAQTGYANGSDWQEEVYQQIKVMKETYLHELSEMYQKIATKLQQHDSLPQQPKSEQLEKLEMFKTMLERLMAVLQISKSGIPPGLKDKLGIYEKQMVRFINTNRPRKQGPPLQEEQLPPAHMHSMHQMGLQQQSNPLQRDMQQRLQASGQISGTSLQAQNVMDQQKQLYQSQRPLPETSSTSLDSSAQTGYANGGDWQEEAYQQSDYMRKFTLKMLIMDTKSQNSMGNPLQSNSAGTMLQVQNLMDQQKQLYQSQRPLPEISSSSRDSSAQTGYASESDWQEEVYQHIKVMKETYLPELSELYQKIATKLQQHDSLPQQPKSEQLETLEMFKTMLERLIPVLQISRSGISPGLKDKLGLYEKQIKILKDFKSDRSDRI